MLSIEHEYGTPIESNFQQNDHTKLYLQELCNNQDKTNYTPQIIENNSSMINIYQSTTNKVSKPKETIYTIPISL